MFLHGESRRDLPPSGVFPGLTEVKEDQAEEEGLAGAAAIRGGGERSMRGSNVPQRCKNTLDAGAVPPKVRYEPRERRLNSIHFLFESSPAPLPKKAILDRALGAAGFTLNLFLFARPRRI